MHCSLVVLSFLALLALVPKHNNCVSAQVQLSSYVKRVPDSLKKYGLMTDLDTFERDPMLRNRDLGIDDAIGSVERLLVKELFDTITKVAKKGCNVLEKIMEALTKMIDILLDILGKIKDLIGGDLLDFLTACDDRRLTDFGNETVYDYDIYHRELLIFSNLTQIGNLIEETTKGIREFIPGKVLELIENLVKETICKLPGIDKAREFLEVGEELLERIIEFLKDEVKGCLEEFKENVCKNEPDSFLNRLVAFNDDVIGKAGGDEYFDKDLCISIYNFMTVIEAGVLPSARLLATLPGIIVDTIECSGTAAADAVAKSPVVEGCSMFQTGANIGGKLVEFVANLFITELERMLVAEERLIVPLCPDFVPPALIDGEKPSVSCDFDVDALKKHNHWGTGFVPKKFKAIDPTLGEKDNEITVLLIKDSRIAPLIDVHYIANVADNSNKKVAQKVEVFSNELSVPLQCKTDAHLYLSIINNAEAGLLVAPDHCDYSSSYSSAYCKPEDGVNARIYRIDVTGEDVGVNREFKRCAVVVLPSLPIIYHPENWAKQQLQKSKNRFVVSSIDFTIDCNDSQDQIGCAGSF